MFCSHLGKFVFCSYMSATITNTESATIRHRRLGTWGDRVDEVMAESGGEEAWPSLFTCVLSLFVLTWCLLFWIYMNHSASHNKISSSTPHQSARGRIQVAAHKWSWTLRWEGVVCCCNSFNLFHLFLIPFSTSHHIKTNKLRKPLLVKIFVDCWVIIVV